MGVTRRAGKGNLGGRAIERERERIHRETTNRGIERYIDRVRVIFEF